VPEWRPTLTSANTDRRPRRTFDMNQRAPRNDVALPQHQIGRGSQLLATASDVDDARFRVLLAKPGNGLADLGRIFQPVGAQAERSEAGEAAAYLCRPGRDLLDRLDQRLRLERLCKIGNAAGFDRGHVNSGTVIGGDVNNWQGNARRLETMPQFDSGFVVQVDVENHATCRIEIVVVLELFGGRKQNAFITVMT
jgi:hypothetical protein